MHKPMLRLTTSARAHSKVRIAQQFGLSYLQLHVALELKLIESVPKSWERRRQLLKWFD